MMFMKLEIYPCTNEKIFLQLHVKTIYVNTLKHYLMGVTITQESSVIGEGNTKVK